MAVAVTAIPQVVALLFGGYPKVIVIVPLALALTLADIAGAAVAGLQLRADRAAGRPSHPLVWIALVLAAPWVVYALYVGVIALLVQVFCISQTCRGPIR